LNFKYLVLNFRVTPAIGGHQGVVMGSHASFVKNALNPRNTHIYILMGLGGSGSQVWPNRAILWGSKAACPATVLDRFWPAQAPFMTKLLLI